MFGIDSGWLLPATGVAMGTLVGFVTRRSHFCTMSALERHWYAGDSNGLRAWVLAAATAMLFTQALVATGSIDLSGSFYMVPMINWAGSILGGLMFGIGMALVGTCAFGAIVRMGGGNLRALVVLTGIGLAALAAQRGLIGHFRTGVIEPLALPLKGTATQSLGEIIAAFSGIDFGFLLPLLLCLAAFAWVFSSPTFRKEGWKIAAGLTLGGAIAGGWLATSFYAQTLMTPVELEAGSFVMPVGDLIFQVITVTGTIPDYGIGLAVGVFCGAAIAAWSTDDMRWEACDDARELGRHLLGAFLMGTGGVLALGCTIGQGVSALSTMSVSAPLSIVAMALGSRLGLGYLVEGAPFGFMQSTRRQPAE